MAEDDEDEGTSTIVQVRAKPGIARRKIVIIAVGAATLLLGGGGGAYYLFGTASEKGDDAPHAVAAEHSANGGGDAFVDVPAMVVNLRSEDGAARFLKIHFMLVPGPNGSTEALTVKLPLLLDAYQPFLRELRPEDLAGSAAVFRIKEQLLLRASGTLGQGQVKDVLIQDLIQQ